MRNVILSFALSALFFVGNLTAQPIFTIAGNDTAGYSGDGGMATAAMLFHPIASHYDKLGNLYVTCYDSSVIRKINTSGIISTFAGVGTNGYSGDGGPATAAQFNGPSGFAFDTSGNMYVVDAMNNCVRVIDRFGIIRTYAGTGIAGFSGDGGRADSAQFNHPEGCIMDKAGNLYISDGLNNCVRKINRAGIITTVAGIGGITPGFSGDSGMATAAHLNFPIGLAMSKKGDLYIADVANQRIRMIDSVGIIRTIAGTGSRGFSGDSGAALTAKLNFPYVICTDTSNNLYILDNNNFRIRKVDSHGIITTIAGTGVSGFSGDGGPASACTFANAAGIDVDAAGNIVLCDFDNNVVRRIGTPINGHVGVASIQTQNTSISISPNPARDIFMLDIQNAQVNQLKVQVIDIYGRITQETLLTGNAGKLHADIDVRELPSGVYLIRTLIGYEPMTAKFIKE